MERIKKEELEKLEAELGWLWKEKHAADAFSFLHAREKQVLDMRLREGKLYSDIGKELGLTTEWVKQMLKRALGHLQAITLESIGSLERMKEVIEATQAVTRRLEQLEQKVIEAEQKYGTPDTAPAGIRDIKINDVEGLSTRAKTICRNVEIETIGDLASYSKKDFVMFRNAGKMTADELEKVLLHYGIKRE
ncbi:MAG: sigma factor-like helix-turn-helix DNA-binding protein [Bacteroidia bacterium]